MEQFSTRQLWTYQAPSGLTTFESAMPVIDNDPRVERGAFVVVVIPKAVMEGVMLQGELKTVVCTSPRSLRNLRNLSLLPGIELRVSGPGELRQVERDVAIELWTFLLGADHGLATWVERLLSGGRFTGDLFTLLRDPEWRLRPWHRGAIERAVMVANAHDRDLSPIILFASFLAISQESSGSNTFNILAGRIAEERSSTSRDPIEILDLQSRLGIENLNADRVLAVSGESISLLNQVISRAHQIKKETDGTEQIESRHFAATFLTNSGVVSYLADLGVSREGLREEMFNLILKAVPGASPDRWRAVLDIPASEQAVAISGADAGVEQDDQSERPEIPPPATGTDYNRVNGYANVLASYAGASPEFSIETIVSRDTWTIDDKLGYALYAKAITESILKGDTEPPLTIGIQAPWGQGKTSLMRMIQEELDPGAPHREEVASAPADIRTAINTTYKQLLAWTKPGDAPKAEMIATQTGQVPTIWFNPLYYRETSQVWAGMAHVILHQLVARLEPAEREKFWFRLQQSRINVDAIRHDVHRWVLTRFIPAGVVLLAGALALLARELFVGLATWAGLSAATFAVFRYFQTQKSIGRPFEQYVTEPNYRSELGLLHLLDHDLDRALGLLVGNKPIAIFIDDLDRCDPQTVNQVVLAINQFLSLPRRNVFFFLGMDMDMVAAALEKAQKDMIGGETLSTVYRRSFGWRFMEKFVQLPFVIPHLEPSRIHAFAMAHLRGKRAVEQSGSTNKLIEKVQQAPSATAVGAVIAALPDNLPDEARIEVQKAASSKVADLMKNNDDEEMKRIAEIAVTDLELNPRTIVRYFCLVRVLRNVQLASGRSTNPDEDRKLVLRAAHLLMNWPQFVQWLRNETEILTSDGDWKPTVQQIEELAAGAADIKSWAEAMKSLVRRDTAPDFLLDVSLHRYLRKLGKEPPGLAAMYEARMF
ncbi:MAG TPA: P-loop NTPase fold protein [Thermoanaerobaculia bacterium]